jgi:hypothetical protein
MKGKSPASAAVPPTTLMETERLFEDNGEAKIATL